MPGSRVRWPFKPRDFGVDPDVRATSDYFGFSEQQVRALLNDDNLRSCPACGAVDRPGETHIAAGHTDRPRKKVCFGLKDSH
jgi:hypothetical protein